MEAAGGDDEQAAPLVDERFAHLLRPLRELADNWQVDLCADLDTYMVTLAERVADLDDAAKLISGAALILQGSAAVYARKVDFVHDYALRILDQVRRRRHKKNADDGDDHTAGDDDGDTAQGGRQRAAARRAKYTENLFDEDLKCLDDAIAPSANIYLKRPLGESQLPVHRLHCKAPLPMSLMPLENCEKSSVPLFTKANQVESIGKKDDFRLNNCIVDEATGALLLELDNLALRGRLRPMGDGPVGGDCADRSDAIVGEMVAAAERKRALAGQPANASVANMTANPYDGDYSDDDGGAPADYDDLPSERAPAADPERAAPEPQTDDHGVSGASSVTIAAAGRRARHSRRTVLTSIRPSMDALLRCGSSQRLSSAAAVRRPSADFADLTGCSEHSGRQSALFQRRKQPFTEDVDKYEEAAETGEKKRTVLTAKNRLLARQRRREPPAIRQFVDDKLVSLSRFMGKKLPASLLVLERNVYAEMRLRKEKERAYRRMRTRADENEHDDIEPGRFSPHGEAAEQPVDCYDGEQDAGAADDDDDDDIGGDALLTDLQAQLSLGNNDDGDDEEHLPIGDAAAGPLLASVRQQQRDRTAALGTSRIEAVLRQQHSVDPAAGDLSAACCAPDGGTYEQMVEYFLCRMAKMTDERLAAESNLTAKLTAWEAKINAIMEVESTRRQFDVHAYAEEVRQRLLRAQGDGGGGEPVPFAQLFDRVPRFEVCRYLLATLMLANTYHVRVGGDCVNELSLQLLDNQKPVARFEIEQMT